MDETSILTGVADTVLDEPVQFDVIRKHKKFWQKSKKSFSITGATLGTMLKISKELLQIDTEQFGKPDVLDSRYTIVESHARRMAKIVAIAVMNRKEPPPESLITLFEENLTARELQTIIAIIVKQMDCNSFILSIVLALGVNVLKSKTNPEDHGSEIARGELSEIL